MTLDATRPFTEQEIRAMLHGQIPPEEFYHNAESTSHKLITVFEVNIYGKNMLRSDEHKDFERLIRRGGEKFGRENKLRGLTHDEVRKDPMAAYLRTISQVHRMWAPWFPEIFA